jgi:aspartate aminotransferase
MSLKSSMQISGFTGLRPTNKIAMPSRVSPFQNYFLCLETNINSEEALNTAYDRAISEGASPRMMLINTPSNPTGRVFSDSTIETIASFCKAKNIILISDEIYSDLCFSPTSIRTSAFTGSSLNTSTVIMTGGLSKTYSAGGWRVGYAIFPSSENGKAIQQTILAYASECWSAASAPAQHAAVVAFSTSPAMDRYRQNVVALHRHCTLRLYAALKGLGLEVAEPEGAFYVYPSFQPYAKDLEKLGVRTSKDLSKWLIEECGVAALPGSAFGEDDEGLVGGRLRLRMATSYLHFADEKERYVKGYEILEWSLETGNGEVKLPLLDEATAALEAAVKKLRPTET